MKRVNIHDAKTNLSRYLAELESGDRLVLCNRNRPVAELRTLQKKSAGKPRIGVAKGEFAVPDSFFEPLPEDIMNAFRGQCPAGHVRVPVDRFRFSASQQGCRCCVFGPEQRALSEFGGGLGDRHQLRGGAASASEKAGYFRPEDQGSERDRSIGDR